MSLSRLDDEIKKILGKHDKALSSSTISILTNKPMRDVVEKLNKMEKFNEVSRHKTMKTRFWKLKKR